MRIDGGDPRTGPAGNVDAIINGDVVGRIDLGHKRSRTGFREIPFNEIWHAEKVHASVISENGDGDPDAKITLALMEAPLNVRPRPLQEWNVAGSCCQEVDEGPFIAGAGVFMEAESNVAGGIITGVVYFRVEYAA